MESREQHRNLIINADDFGLSRGINRGIIEARERGIVTSASLMVRYSSSAEAAAYARDHPTFSVGLHFDAAEWRFDGNEWKAAYEVVNSRDAQAVRMELKRQLKTFEALVGHLPTHLDSHQHVHSSEPARSVLLELANELGVPLRSCTGAIIYRGDFYGQTGDGKAFPEGVSLQRLKSLVKELPEGWTELGCHPGYSEGLDSVYSLEREEELRVLTNHEALQLLADSGSVRLRSFSDFNRKLF